MEFVTPIQRAVLYIRAHEALLACVHEALTAAVVSASEFLQGMAVHIERAERNIEHADDVPSWHGQFLQNMDLARTTYLQRFQQRMDALKQRADILECRLEWAREALADGAYVVCRLRMQH